jgi:hypothetical protein
MNKEIYNQIIEDFYKIYYSYASKLEEPDYDVHVEDLNQHRVRCLTKEEFMNQIKIDKVFSERWSLKIDELNLTNSERYKIWFANNYETGVEYNENVIPDFDNEYYEKTPTKLITVTYKNEKLEFYE